MQLQYVYDVHASLREPSSQHIGAAGQHTAYHVCYAYGILTVRINKKQFVFRGTAEKRLNMFYSFFLILKCRPFSLKLNKQNLKALKSW